jgi:hypothetical protein
LLLLLLLLLTLDIAMAPQCVLGIVASAQRLMHLPVLLTRSSQRVADLGGVNLQLPQPVFQRSTVGLASVDALWRCGWRCGWGAGHGLERSRRGLLKVRGRGAGHLRGDGGQQGEGDQREDGAGQQRAPAQLDGPGHRTSVTQREMGEG